MVETNPRRNILIGAVVFITLIFATRLFYLQVLSKEYSQYATNNVVKKVILKPLRGSIYDRNGKLYVTNQPNFSLYFIPKKLVIQREKDTLLLSTLLGIPTTQLKHLIYKSKRVGTFRPRLLKNYLSQKDFAGISSYLWRFNGIQVKPENIRLYKMPYGAHFLGYINEVNDKDIEKDKQFYRMGDVIGRSGIEKYYEKELRGKKGVKMILENVYGKEVGSFANGKYDTLPKPGNKLVLSIDAELQKFAEELMQNKRGAIVAIEPKTGEILVSVSAPYYNPNLLAGANIKKNWVKLQSDPNKPMYNRVVQAQYPPGSIFKLLNGLIAVQEHTLHPTQTFYGCIGGFPRNKGRPKCHNHASPLNLIHAIQHSCNAFFAAVYVDYLHNRRRFKNIYEAYDKWYNYMKEFGIGRKLGVDIPYESKGILPSSKYYDKLYGKKRWNAMTIISNSIGQGEVSLTPLQMANVAAAIANKGWYITPHYAKEIIRNGKTEKLTFDTTKISIDSTLFNYIIEGMELVVTSGTGYWARVPDIKVCGKTGTAQNPHGKDHSVFIAFAPKEDPKIAVAVVIENAGFGGVWAAPTAALIIEIYLKGAISKQNKWQIERIKNADFIHKKKNYAENN